MESASIGFACGDFDVFGAAHIRYLQAGQAHCDLLSVGVLGDHLAASLTGRAPMVPFLQRFQIVNAVRLVDITVPVLEPDILDLWETMHFDKLLLSSAGLVPASAEAVEALTDVGVTVIDLEAETLNYPTIPGRRDGRSS